MDAIDLNLPQSRDSEIGDRLGAQEASITDVGLVEDLEVEHVVDPDPHHSIEIDSFEGYESVKERRRPEVILGRRVVEKITFEKEIELTRCDVWLVKATATAVVVATGTRQQQQPPQ